MPRALLPIALLTLALGARAQAWDVFNMVNAGFPSNTISDLAIDSQDHVWAGTDWGLCYYDGSSWSVFQAGSSGLPDNVINAVAVDSLDHVWIGTVLHGLVEYDGSTWTTYTTQNSGLPDDEIKCITIDHRGWIWVGTYLGLACYTGQEWRLYNDSDTSYNGLRLNGNVIEDVAVRTDGLVAVGTLNYGFHYLTDTSVFVYSSYFNMFPDNTQTGVAFDYVNDERWLSCPAGGVLRQGGPWHGGPWFQYTDQNSTLPTNTLLCVAPDPLGRVWLGGSLAGLIVRNLNETFTSYTTGNSDIPDNTVQNIAIAHDGDIWVATYYGGVARLHLSTASTAERAPASAPQLFPQPVNEDLQVRWDVPGDRFEWSLWDAQGRALRKGRSAVPAFSVPMGDLAAGAYVLTILTGERTVGQRVVKQ